MRGVRIASTVAVSAVLVGALAACGSSAKKSVDTAKSPAAPSAPAGGAGGGLGPKGELLAAAAVMQKAGSAKVNVSSSDDTSGDGNGVYSWAGKPALDLSMMESGKPMKIRIVDGQTYLGVDDQQAAAVGGKHWLKLDNSGPTASMSGTFQALLVMLDPSIQLTAAAQNGKLTKIGAEPVGGVATEHYQSVMPADTLIASLPNLSDAVRKDLTDSLKQDGSTVTSDFWVNGQHQLVQQSEVGSDPASAAPSDKKPSKATTKYSDLGIKATITAPAASDQIDPTLAAKLFGGN